MQQPGGLLGRLRSNERAFDSGAYVRDGTLRGGGVRRRGDADGRLRADQGAFDATADVGDGGLGTTSGLGRGLPCGSDILGHDSLSVVVGLVLGTRQVAPFTP